MLQGRDMELLLLIVGVLFVCAIMGWLILAGLFLAVFLALVLLDAALFFLLIRIIVRFAPARFLLLLDRVGEVGVEAVTNVVMAKTRHWFKQPLTRTQEYAFTFCLLAVARMLLGVVVRVIR